MPQPIDPSWRGRRVVLRRRLGPDRFTDVLGTLVDSGDPVRIRRENGEIVAVDRAAVHRVKVVPPRPVPRLSALELAEVAAAGWPAPDVAWLGGWLLRAAEGWTGRANSVLPLGEPDRPVEAALAAVRAWYAERDLPARFQLAEPGHEALANQLPAEFQPGPASLVLVGSLSGLSEPTDPTLPPVRLSPTPSTGWLAVLRGGGSPPVARTVLTGPERVAFASVESDGVVLAIGRASVDAGWLGLTTVEVVPAARRRGLARLVIAALATWGAGAGARHAYLQVGADNGPALALYDRLGWRTHHRYRYWTDRSTAAHSSA